MSEAFRLEDTIDGDRYPTEETERMIREFEGSVYDLMSAIKQVWAYADWGWREEEGKDILDKPVHRWNISTAGWSGNESIIQSLEENVLFWAFYWVQGRKGGHYIFEAGESLTQVIQLRKTPTPIPAPAAAGNDGNMTERGVNEGE